jgi:hypothetical protein
MIICSKTIILKNYYASYKIMATDQLEQLDFSVSPEVQKFVRENSWVSFTPEMARDSKSVEYLRKKGSQITYRKVGANFECTVCGSDIIEGKIAHAIWDGPFPMSGSGKCYDESVPYCPKCEKAPEFHGTPISVGEKMD